MKIFNRESKDRETNTADQPQMGPNDQAGRDFAENAAHFSTSILEPSIEAWSASAGLNAGNRIRLNA